MRSRSPEARQIERLMELIWFTYYKAALDQMPAFDPGDSRSSYYVLRKHFMGNPWNEVFDLLEFIVKSVPRDWQGKLLDFLNQILMEENSAYRFVNLEIAEITDENEIEAVESATSLSPKSVGAHLKRSLELLTDRKTPDYRNSMKESISAVEAVCQAIAGKPGATLGDCLKVVKTHRQLHPALEQSLLKLYGFTSDSGGIRHAMTDETPSPTYADAKFMLVSCSALTNYLRTLMTEK
jgi:hypothetical protein